MSNDNYMMIRETPQGFTVLRNSDNVCMLKDKEGNPQYFTSRDTLKTMLTNAGYYEAREGNPRGLPAGTIITFHIEH